ncbi:hypothetical protein EG68_00672 [Paragonimus skrjabini miyazakii]|uniref:Uncharacterized protein n=1 Tax=Paragonimus skrjabini miyazakii TaxID=59628 RepID=A0A8S9ZCM3_9TREM|nr:hypothetical protein EG68_00672 [Paragonimus skrjabini miyazakii]
MLATFLRGVVWISSVFIVSHHPINLLIALITIFTLFTNVQRRYFRRSEAGKRSLTTADSQKDATRAVLQESPKSEMGDRQNLNHCQMRVSRTNGLSESKTKLSTTTKVLDECAEPHPTEVAADSKQEDDTIIRQQAAPGRFKSLVPTSLRSYTSRFSRGRLGRASLEPWRAVKALLYLMPLLGYPQLILLRPYSVAFENFFSYTNAVIIALQVSCFVFMPL